LETFRDMSTQVRTSGLLTADADRKSDGIKKADPKARLLVCTRTLLEAHVE